MYGRRGAAPENKPVCNFWKKGQCRFGNDCKFRHSDDSGSTTTTSTSTTWTNNANTNNANNSKGNQRLNRNNPFLLDKDAIKADLTEGEEKPQWPCSCYGPGRDAPLQLIEGPELEISMEEMRVQAYAARDSGQVEQYLTLESSKLREAQAMAAKIVHDVDDAIKYVQDGTTREGNRIAQVTKDAAAFPPKEEAGFGRQSQAPPPTGLSTFGHTSHGNQNPAFPSRLGPQGAFAKPQQATLGGAPSFGQPSLVGSAAFGRPSQPTSAFGQPSQAAPTFGKPAQPASTFGQPSQSRPTFGQPSQPAPAFGKPSQPAPAFGWPSQPTPASGQPSQPAPAFGKLSQPTSAFGQASKPTPAFGQPSQPASTFGQQPQPTSTFGQPSQGQQPNPSSGFGQSSQQPTPFGAGSAPQQQQQSQGGFATFGKPSAQAPTNPVPTGPRAQQPQSQAPQPAPSSSAAAPATTGTSSDPDAEGPPEAYDGPLGQALKAAYQAVWETGRFGDVVPEIPPKREWVSFDV